MYPSERNRQPSQPGTSFRVGSRGYRTSDEVSYKRGANLEYCKRAGTLYVHWRRFTPDWNPGRCPRCFNETFSGAINAECPVCYGTGYRGGFARPVIQWMVVQDQNESIDKTALGYIRINKSESVSPYLPEIRDWDLLAQLVLIPDVTEATGFRYETDERYVVEGTVRPERMRDSVVAKSFKDADHLMEDEDITGYRFTCSLLPKHSDERLRSVHYKVPLAEPIWLADANHLKERI